MVGGPDVGAGGLLEIPGVAGGLEAGAGTVGLGAGVGGWLLGAPEPAGC